MKYIDISNHAEVLEYYHRGNQILGSLGYTDHSTVHTKLVAQRAAEKGIKQVVFDRGGYSYQGKIAALAEAAREAGLEF